MTELFFGLSKQKLQLNFAIQLTTSNVVAEVNQNLRNTLLNAMGRQ